MKLPVLLRLPLAGIAIVALIAACTGAGDSPTPTLTMGSPGASPSVTDFSPTPGAPSPTMAETGSPGMTMSPATPTNGTGVGGNECAGVPTFAPGGPEPSLTPDLELEAFFPATIAGNPVTDVESLRWVEFICMFGGQAAVDQIREDSDAELNLIDLSFATAEVMLDGETVEMAAFRYPVEDANLLEEMVRIARTMGGQQGEVDLQTGSVGGKTVVWWMDGDDRVYTYQIGQIVFSVDGVTEAQAEQIFSALP